MTLKKRFARYWILANIAPAALLASLAMAQDISPDTAPSNEAAGKLDPEDYHFVQPVCTRCHTASRFLHYRGWPQWQATFHNMIGNGAVGTPEQWDHIDKYFQRNLTTLDVNNAGEDEIAAVLSVSEKTAIDIVRYERGFTGAADLEAIPGVDRTVVEQIEPRLLFNPRRKN